MTQRIQPMTLLVIAALGLLASGGYALMNLASEGHAAFNSSNNGLHWTFPIVVYDYFLLTSTGLAMIAALLSLFGEAAFRPFVRRSLWLAIAALIGGVAVLFLELGHPLRALYAIPLSFAVTSALWWKVLFVIAYLVLLVLLFARMPQKEEDPAPPRILSLLLLLAALAVTGTAGVVYGSVTFRPFWASGDIPVAFIFESLVGGIAFALFFTYLYHGFDQNGLPPALANLFRTTLPKAFGLLVAVHLMFVIGRLVIGLNSNVEGMQVWQQIVASPLFYLEVAALAVALFLMLNPSTRSQAAPQGISALLVMVALLIGRYEYIIGGQLVPMFKGAWAPPILSYTPSATEWALLVMAIFLANLVTAFGEQRFRFTQ